MFRLLLAIPFVLGAGTVASADSKVDWSQFIEKPGDKPPPVTHAAAAEPVASKAPAKEGGEEAGREVEERRRARRSSAPIWRQLTQR